MPPPDFDRIAPLYRWLEYATLGRALERTRCHHLPALATAQNALIFGDGDGRFTARLLARYPHLRAHAVDTSARMLALLRARTPSPNLRTTRADALALQVQSADLVVTHFFLDCLTQAQAETLILRHAPAARLWLTSEFHVPPGPLRYVARALIRILYFAFRILTGLRITHIPDYQTPLLRAGFTPTPHCFLAGLLVTTLWRRIQPEMTNQPSDAQPSKSRPLGEDDPQSNPEPIAPSLDQPDPGVFHHDVEPA